MFNFFKKHKAQVEPEQVLSVSDRVLNIFSRIEGLDDIKEMMLLSLGDNNLAVRFCSGICFTIYCGQLFASLRNDPDKQLLIYDAAELPSMNAIISSSQNPESYSLYPHHKRILKLAEIYYDELLKFAAYNAISQAVEKKDIINKQIY
jgi:hypothetical protein